MAEGITDPFLAFARAQGVTIDPSQLEADGRIHRADVGDTPSGKNDAGYLLRPDGTGWITNFKADGKAIQFRPELARELTPEEKAQAELQRTVWRQKQAERQAVAVEDAVGRWEASQEPNTFPYLQEPPIEPAGLRQGRAQLLVPMLAIDSAGEPGWVGMQRIVWAAPGQSADKRFVSGTPTRGAFAVIPIVGADVEAPLRAYESACKADQVVICEGIGTALAIHQATGLPVIAAMSAQNLPEVARGLHDKLQGRAVIYADNDGEKAQFKGQSYAVRAVQILGAATTRIALPEKPNGITPPGYDARDQIRDGGAEGIRKTMGSLLEAQQLEQRLPPGVLITRPARDGPITPRPVEREPLERQPQEQGTAFTASTRDLNNTNHQENTMAETQDNKDFSSWRAAVRADAYQRSERGSLSPAQIESGLTDTNTRVREIAGQHARGTPGFAVSPEHIARGLADKSPDVRAGWVAHSPGALSAAQLDSALTDRDGFVRRSALLRPGVDLSPAQKERALVDPDHLVRRDAINSGMKLDTDQVERALTDKNTDVRIAMLKRPDVQLTQEQASRAMGDKEGWVRLAALDRPDVTPSTADLDRALIAKNFHESRLIQDKWKQAEQSPAQPIAIDPALYAVLDDPISEHLKAAAVEPGIQLHPAIEPVALRAGDSVVADLRAVTQLETGQSAALMQADKRSLLVAREDGKSLPESITPMVGQRVGYGIDQSGADQAQVLPITIDPALLRAIDDDLPDLEVGPMNAVGPATPQEQAILRAAPALEQGPSTATPSTPFDALNQAAAKAEAAMDHDKGSAAAQAEPGRSITQEPVPTANAETPEARLIRQWHELADPVREQRAKAQYDQAAEHRVQREGLFGGMAQLREEKGRELAGIPEIHRDSLIALEVGKAHEALEKRQAQERKTLQSSLPEVPSYLNLLEQRAPTDPDAAKLLEAERERGQAQQTIKGRRVAPLEPSVLEGLTHEMDVEAKAVHYSRDGERVMTDHGERVDLYKMDDREIEAGLRLAAQKYDLDKGLVLTGSREFQERTAELAGKMGLKVQNADLQQTWQQGRMTAMQGEELGSGLETSPPSAPAPGLNGIAAGADVGPAHPDGNSYPIDKDFMAIQAVRAHLSVEAENALSTAGRGEFLTPEQRLLLNDGVRQDLIDEKDHLTPIGQLVHDDMWSKVEEEAELFQQQLRARNVEEELKKREHDKEVAAQKSEERAVEQTSAEVEAQQEHAEERASEVVAEEQEIKAPEVALPVRPRSAPQRSGGIGF